jgi:nucleotide-binding universal stress UspA family protein
VATDLGEASQAALRLAVAVTRAFAADLLIVHVLRAPPDLSSEIRGLAMTSGDLLERRLAQAEVGLRRAKAIAGDGHAHAAIRCGTAAAEIVRLANETDADLIVLGRPAAGGIPSGVAIEVERHAPCPVLVVPAGYARESPKGAEHVPPHGVLIATSGASTAAVAYGRALAQRLHCPVHALHPWRGHSALHRVLRGSVLRNVAARAACATLVVGPHCRWRDSGRLETHPGAAAAAG